VTEPDVRARAGIAEEGRDASQPTGRRGRFFPFARRSSAVPPGRENRRSQGLGILRTLKRFWIPLVILAVLVAGGVTVTRLHGIFGSEKRPSYADTRQQDTKPFNPKRVQYQVFGPPGTTADISYFDVNGEPQHINGIHLPWTFDIATTLPSIVANVVGQGDSDTLGCRIVVDGVVKAERISHELNAFTYCVLTAT
jgi:Mycobacterium membrane protein